MLHSEIPLGISILICERCWIWFWIPSPEMKMFTHYLSKLLNLFTWHLHVCDQVKRIRIISRSEEFHFGGSSVGEMPYFMQFSVATHKLCTLHCVLLNCNGTKCTGNTLSIPAAACSQQLLRRNKLPTGCYFFACLVFSSHDMNVFVTDLTADNVVTHMQGFSSGILMILFEKLCDIWTILINVWLHVWLTCSIQCGNLD